MNLEFKEIEKSFGEKRVLSNLSFKVEGGKAFGLLGRNGAGKTTSIRILMNVFPADNGVILLDGKPIDYKNVRIGYLPEERGMYPKRTIIEQLVYFAQLKGMTRKDAHEANDYWLDRLDMSEYRNKRLDTLSKGNQQKIQLITALAHNPDIIILDEPFSGLDPVNAMQLKQVVKEQIAQGKIVLFSSHQMNYIEEFCEKVAILNSGRIVLWGDIGDIKHNYRRDYLRVRAEASDKIAKDYGGRCVTMEDGSVLIKLLSEDEKKEEMKHLVEQYDVDEIHVYEPSLNDIFVEYTKTDTEGGKR